MVSKESKEKLIQNILNSKNFSRSGTSKKLLKYMFDSHLSDVELKEINIAIDVFGRGDDFISSDDTVVRVNIYNLKKRIEEYFFTEGIDEEVRVEIPKGKYSLSFKQTETEKKVEAPQKTSPRKLVVAFGVLLLIINLGFWLFTSSGKPKEVNSIWEEYWNSPNDVSIVMGNPFFFHLYDSESETYLTARDFKINSWSDLQKTPYATEKEKYKLEPLNFPYYSNNNIEPLSYLFNALSGIDKKLDIKSAEEVTFDEIKNKNVIFLSNKKAIGRFAKFLEPTSFQITTKNNSNVLQFVNNTDTTFYSAHRRENDYYDDYGILVKVPSPNRTSLMMFIDSHSLANKALMEFVGKEDAVDVILKDFPALNNEFPKYFEMLVKVSGFRNEDLSMEVLYFGGLE